MVRKDDQTVYKEKRTELPDLTRPDVQFWLEKTKTEGHAYLLHCPRSEPMPPNSFILSEKSPDGSITHYLIKKEGDIFKFSLDGKEYNLDLKCKPHEVAEQLRQLKAKPNLQQAMEY